MRVSPLAVPKINPRSPKSPERAKIHNHRIAESFTLCYMT